MTQRWSVHAYATSNSPQGWSPHDRRRRGCLDGALLLQNRDAFVIEGNICRGLFVHRSAEGRYWGLPRSRVIAPTAGVIGTPPIAITVHELMVTVPREPHPHLQAKHDDLVATGTELGPVLMVIGHGR
jgi:hypothetical protein